MFDSIAPRYDFLNHFLSMGIDILWRRKAVRMLKPYKPEVVLDIATGTGDFAIEATKLEPKEIIGLAYDLGGVTTSTVTVPLVTALGVGLARTIRRR